jgi:glycerophosphoryl diester phosphodiesterase
MRGSLILTALFFILHSCTKQKGFDDILVLGHAATGLDRMNSVYQDNSREAMEFALSVDGCNGVEMDLQLSQDGKMWFYHDVQLESQTNGQGCIPDKTSSELSGLHYKSVHQEGLFQIEDLDILFLKGKHLFLDLRHYNECGAAYVSIDQVISQLESHGLKDPETFTVHCITGYKGWIQPLINAGFNVCFSVYNMEDVAQSELAYPSLEGYVVRNKDFTTDDVSNIHKANKKVYIFEVRSPKGIRRALKKHPDGIITDDIRATLIEKY